MQHGAIFTGHFIVLAEILKMKLLPGSTSIMFELLPDYQATYKCIINTLMLLTVNEGLDDVR